MRRTAVRVHRDRDLRGIRAAKADATSPIQRPGREHIRRSVRPCVEGARAAQWVGPAKPSGNTAKECR